MREIKSKTFVYKRAAFAPRSKGMTLSMLVRQALSALPTIGERRQGLGHGDTPDEWLVIGNHSGNEDIVFGVLMRYAPGTAAATLLDDASAKRVQVETFDPPQDGPTRREFVDGLLFFTVAGNHVELNR